MAKTPDKTVNNGGVTPEQLESWKQTHGEVHEIRVNPEAAVDDQTNGTSSPKPKVAYLRKPRLKELMKVQAHLAKMELISVGVIILNECWLGGADELRNPANDEYYVGACFQAAGMVQVAGGETVKH